MRFVLLYQRVLDRELGELVVVPGHTSRRVPTVLSRMEVGRLLAVMEGHHQLAAQIMYGSGLRLAELCSLRVQEVSIERRQMTVRDGKGGHDRITVLPSSVIEQLSRQLERVLPANSQDDQWASPARFLHA